MLKRTSGKIIVDARVPTALTVHFPECLCLLKPSMQFESADTEGMVQVLAGTRAKTVE
jgi:hypothetical protein